MKIKIALVLILNALIVIPAIAGDVYRWTNPETGKLLVTPSLPPYPIKETRTAGNLPNGYMIDVILDNDSPEIQAIIKKHKTIADQLAREQARERAVQEAEERKIAEEQARERAVQEAEERKIAAKNAVKEAEERKIAEEQAKVKAEQEAEQKRIAAENAEKEAEQRRIIEAELERIAAEKSKKIEKKMIKARSKKDDDKDVSFMLNIIDEFKQYNKFALSTARINLAIPINNLVNTKVKLDSYQISKCYHSSKIQLQNWMDYTIKSFNSFSTKYEYESVKYMAQSDKELENFWLTFPDFCGLFGLW